MSKKKKRVNTNSDTKGHSKTNVKKYECHKEFVEIFPGFFIGAKRHLDENILLKIDTLIPLDSVGGEIWDTGWRGELLYVPIKDYDILPPDLEDLLVNIILEKIASKKNVAIFCLGGHGRTGYIASLVLGKLGFSDPIDYIRKKYCKDAIECNSQVRAIARYLDKPEFVDKYYIDDFYWSWGYYSDYFFDYKSYKSDKKTSVKKDTCKNCGHISTIYDGCHFGRCEVKQKTVSLSDTSCNAFVDILSY